MTRLSATARKTLMLLPRAALLVAVLAAPLLAMPAAAGGDQVAVIEAPGLKKTGAGFVILMSLQRG